MVLRILDETVLASMYTSEYEEMKNVTFDTIIIRN